MAKKIKRVLIANRGEIAVRIARTCHDLGIETVTLYAEQEDAPLHSRVSDYTHAVKTRSPLQAYTDGTTVMEVAEAYEADAIHPGYGFLSEDAKFAERVSLAGLIWVGPNPATMRLMANKNDSRHFAQIAGVPIVPGNDNELATANDIAELGSTIGYPVLLKPADGGGGVGMIVVSDEAGGEAGFAQARALSERLYGSTNLVGEKLVQNAKHVEVQLMGFGDGTAKALGTRDCSIQRRNQKIVEESPAPALGEPLREALESAAVRVAAAANYENAGTVEFLVDMDTREFYFIEMNTRLQVEHPITEVRYGIDLVELQLLVAEGCIQSAKTLVSVVPRGHSIEFRLCAEDPYTFMPKPGAVAEFDIERIREWARVDTGYEEHDIVTSYFDSLVAKIIVHEKTRDEAISKLRSVLKMLDSTAGRTNSRLYSYLADDPTYADGTYLTTTLETLSREQRSQ